MLTISPIKSVQSTINNKISFTSGPRSNSGANVINTTDVRKEGSFLTDFLGTIKQSPLFLEAFYQRQASIEKGLETQENKINAIA
jgi:hypothetical protein